jgi:hypothetical protein
MPGLEVVAAAADRFGIPGQGYGGGPDGRVGEQTLQAAAVRVMLAVIGASVHPAVSVARCGSQSKMTPMTLNIHRTTVLPLKVRKVLLEFADMGGGSLQLIGELEDLNNGVDPCGKLLRLPRGDWPALGADHLVRPRL